MRRKTDQLLPVELDILSAGLRLKRQGIFEFHGFLMAREIREEKGYRTLTSHGTLYKALARLERMGLLESTWEDPSIAAQERRPQRRLYKVTAVGQHAVARTARSVSRWTPQWRQRPATP